MNRRCRVCRHQLDRVLNEIGTHPLCQPGTPDELAERRALRVIAFVFPAARLIHPKRRKDTA